MAAVAREATRKLVAQAIVRRASPSESEALLWASLRNRRLDGFKFRRQAIVLGQVAPFYCPEARLVVEVGGWTAAEIVPGEGGVRVLRLPAVAPANITESLQRVRDHLPARRASRRRGETPAAELRIYTPSHPDARGGTQPVTRPLIVGLLGGPDRAASATCDDLGGKAIRPAAALSCVDRDLAVGSRTDAMRPQVPATGPIPLLLARPDVIRGGGLCCSCGELLGAEEAYRCALCVAAAVTVLETVE